MVNYIIVCDMCLGTDAKVMIKFDYFHFCWDHSFFKMREFRAANRKDHDE